MTLAKDEQIIKSWNYAKKEKLLSNNVTTATLIVTNKRIINCVDSNISLSTNEIPLSSVKGVMGSNKKNNWLKILILVGLGFFILYNIFGILLSFTVGHYSFSISSIVMVSFSFLIILAIVIMMSTKKGGFNLQIITKGNEGVSLFIGMECEEKTLNKKSLFDRIFKKHDFMTVKEDIAREIIETINSIIIENN